MHNDFEHADNGRWYRHALIGEPSRWYVCFDDETDPQLVIRMMRKPVSLTHPNRGDKMEVYMEAADLIRHFNLPVELVERNANCHCLFPDDRGRFSGKMLQSISYKVRLTAPLPYGLLLSYEEMFDQKPDEEGVFYP